MKTLIAKLEAHAVPHRMQRYRTVGDYFESKGRWVFKISRMRDRRYVWLVLLHEIIEWGICKLQGISNQAIDRFDIAYEKTRSSGKAPCGCQPRDEPGEDTHAPYREAHLVATECERLVARAVGVDWIAYSETVEKL